MTKRQRIHPVEHAVLLVFAGLGIYAFFVAISLEQKLKEQVRPQNQLEQALSADGGTGETR